MKPEDIMVQRLDDIAWIDATGALHIEVPSLLARLGMPDTEQNRTEAVKMVSDLLAEEWRAHGHEPPQIIECPVKPPQEPCS